MSISLNNSVNNQIEVMEVSSRTPSPTKKPKQMTLFDMGSKGRFSLSCSNNRVMSPQFKKEEKSMKKSKSNSQFNEDKENSSFGIKDCIIILDDCNADKKLTSDKENNQLSKEVKKRVPKKVAKKETVKQKNNEKTAEAEIKMDTDDCKIIDISKNEKVKSEEKTKSPKSPKNSTNKSPGKVAEKKNDSKQMNLSGFFTKSANSDEKFNILPPKPEHVVVKVVAPKIEKEIIPIDYNLLEKVVVDKGHVIFKDDDEFQNHMFGDINEAIQLYNSLVLLYTKNHFLPHQVKVNKWAIKDTKLTKDKPKIDDTLLEYNSFLQTIKANCTGKEKKSYYDLIRNLLKILFKFEKEYKREIFGCPLDEIELSDCYLQDLCRIVEVTSLKEAKMTEQNIFDPDLEKLGQSNLLSLLDTNRSEEAFDKYTTEQKLDLIKAIAIHIISTGEKFNNYLDTAQDKVANLKAVLSQLRGELWEKLNIVDKSKLNLKTELRKNTKTDWLEQLEKKEKQHETALLNVTKVERFSSLGVDSKEQVYWFFPAFKNLVVEKKIDLEKSSWYSIDHEHIKELMSVLKKCKQDKNLLTNLQDIYDKQISKEIVVESDNDTIPDDDSNCDIKDKLAKFEKRETRSLARRSVQNALDEINSMSTSDTDEEDLKTLTPDNESNKLKEEWLNYMNKVFDTKQAYTLDNLVLFFVNKGAYVSFSGNVNDDKYEEFKELVREYRTMSEFDEKFECVKKIMTSSVPTIIYKCRLIFLEAGRKGVWQEMVMQSKSLSNLYLLTYCNFFTINWRMMQIIACDLCKKRGSSFETLKSLSELDTYYNDEVECKIGFYSCYKCDHYKSKTRLTHKKCYDVLTPENYMADIDQFTNEQNSIKKERFSVNDQLKYKCYPCASKVTSGTAYEFINSEEEEEEEVVDPENRYRKSKKIVNYDEKIRRASNRNRYSISSKSSMTDQSEDEVVRKSKKPERTASKRVSKKLKEEAPPTRSSFRIIASRTETKKPNYADNGLSTDEGSDTE